MADRPPRRIARRRGTRRIARRRGTRRIARRRGTRRRALTATRLAGFLVLVSGAVAYAATRSGGPAYRTATVGSGDVAQTLRATGTIQPASSATVAFPVSGTVADVAVAASERVAAGQRLASLDTTSLRAKVASAKADLADAELTLHDDTVRHASGSSTSDTTAESASSADTGAQTVGGQGTGAQSTATPTGRTSTTTPTSRAVAATAQQVQVSQQRVDLALAEARAHLAAATKTCSAGSASPTSGFAPSSPTADPTTSASASPTPTPTTTPTASPTSTAVPTSTPTTTPTGTSNPPTGGSPHAAACTAALQRVLADETAVLKLQRDVSGRLSALTRAVTASARGSAGGSGSTGSGSTGSGSTGTGSTGTGSTGTGSTGSGSTGSGSTGSGSSTGSQASARSSTGSAGSAAGSSTTVTDAQLAADQANVTAAQAALAVAEQDLQQATIVSPIAGIVSTVGLTAGQPASAGSSTAAVTVIGGDTHVVTLTVDVSKVGRVKQGAPATVTPDGSATALPATVVAVGAAPTSSGASGYLVTLGFSGRPTRLRDGVNAAVTLTTAAASDVLRVPTSAVHVLGQLATVTVLDSTGPRTARVTVGAVGPDYTEITSGLKAGDQVVLADVDQAIPTRTTNTPFGRSGSSLTGTVPGGGAFVSRNGSGGAGPGK